MKANSRRRVLISSIAMLLVALVALSTATFAWFTQDTSATASNIGAQTTKSSELLLSKSDLAWGDTVDYNKLATTLRPATSADGENWYNSVAADKDESTSNGTYNTISAANLDDYVIVDMLNIKNNGGQVCNNVRITVTADMPSNFARLAIVPCDEQKKPNEMPSAATNFASNIYGSAKDDAWTPYLGESEYKTVDAASGKVITVGNMPANSVKSYKIIVWFEGEDSNCFDTTKSDLTVPSISFTVAGETAQG